jgi:hypothetical protein
VIDLPPASPRRRALLGEAATINDLVVPFGPTATACEDHGALR